MFTGYLVITVTLFYYTSSIIFYLKSNSSFFCNYLHDFLQVTVITLRLILFYGKKVID